MVNTKLHSILSASLDLSVQVWYHSWLDVHWRHWFLLWCSWLKVAAFVGDWVLALRGLDHDDLLVLARVARPLTVNLMARCQSSGDQESTLPSGIMFAPAHLPTSFGGGVNSPSIFCPRLNHHQRRSAPRIKYESLQCTSIYKWLFTCTDLDWPRTINAIDVDHEHANSFNVLII